MAQDLQRAKDYIAGLDFSMVKRGIVPQDAADPPGEVFDKAKEQALVVGSGMFAFTVGVTKEVREAISDSALVAQLVANTSTSQQDAPIKWFNEYSGCLQNLGWTLQEGAWSDYTKEGSAAEVHEQISGVLAAVLGPGAAALTIITATVAALKKMEPTTPWIRIFGRESQQGKIGRFQVGLVEKGKGDDVFVSLLACLVEADSNVTQILVFKWRAAKASFQANYSKVSINAASLKELGPEIRKQTREYQRDYVSKVFNIIRPPKK